MSKVFKYIIDFDANTKKLKGEMGSTTSMLKAGAVALGAFFAVDKIMDAANAVADYGKEIDAIRTKAQGLTGLSGAALNAVTGQVKAVANVYGKEWSEVLDTANAMSKQFGITNQQSMEYLRKGLATGADNGGDFLEQIREYSTQFKAAGTSASEMVAIMSESGQKGIFSDKGADTIKEGMLRIREMTTTTAAAFEGIGMSSTEIQKGLQDGSLKSIDVIKMVGARLKELPANSAQVGTAIADIFGGAGEDAGLDYIKTLADINLNLDTVFKNTDEASKANEALVESQAKLHTISASVFGGMGTGWTKTKTLMLDFVSSALNYGAKVVNWFIDMYNESMVFRAGIQYIKMSFENMWAAVKFVFSNLWNSLKSTGKLLKAVFSGAWGEIPGIIKEGFSEAIDNAAQFGNKVANNFADAFNATVSPREKIAYVNLDIAQEQAGESGKKTGETFANAFNDAVGKGLASPSTPRVDMQKISSPVIDMPQVTLPKISIDTKALVGDAGTIQQVMAGLNAEMAKATEMSKLYGNEQSLLADKKRLLQSAIEELINDGYAADSVAVQGVIESYKQQGVEVDGLLEKQRTFKDFQAQLSSSLMDVAEQGAASFSEMGAVMANVVRSIIKTYLAQTIAAAIAQTVGSSPLGLFLAPAAAAMANTAFNQLIPAFADGGLVYGPTMGLVGEYAGASSNPEVIAPLDKLKSIIRNESGGGTGEVRFEIEGNKLVGVLNNHNKRINSYR